MKEFVIDAGLLMEIQRFDTAGQHMNGAYTAVDSSAVDTLATSKEYIAQCTAVKQLLDEYAGLVSKDAQDLREMIIMAQTKDRGIARLFRK